MANFDKAGKKFAAFCELVAALRDPKTGCPWDLQQDHETLQRYMIEEAYEAVAEMQRDAHHQLASELGDVLLQVVLNAQVAKDDHRFSIEAVIDAIHDKMLRRHPHVFGSDQQKQQRDIPSIKANWQAIKDQERRDQDVKQGFFAKHDVEKIFPATLQAAKIGKLSRKIDFDWPDAKACFAHFLSEVDELKTELNAIDLQIEPDMEAAEGQVVDELADVYFTLAQLTRHLGLSPEVVAARGNQKFLRRFAAVEARLQQAGQDSEQAGGEVLNRVWQEVKPHAH